mgnify:CR=1 FL=1
MIRKSLDFQGCALVAQLDRALASDARCRWFESSQVRLEDKLNMKENSMSFKDKMKKHADVYTKVLSDVVGNVDIDNEALAKLYARSITSNYSIKC